jgi:hypothetical protein
VYSVLYSEIALSRKPFGIGHMYIYSFCLEWPILWPPRILTFPLGHCMYMNVIMKIIVDVTSRILSSIWWPLTLCLFTIYSIHVAILYVYRLTQIFCSFSNDMTDTLCILSSMWSTLELWALRRLSDADRLEAASLYLPLLTTWARNLFRNNLI